MNPGPLRSTRRAFITQAAAGTALPFALKTASAATSPDPGIKNDWLAVAFDPASARLHVRLADGAEFLTGAQARAQLPNELRSSGHPAYRHAVEVVPLHDRLGDGQQLVVRSTDGDRQLDFELRVSLYEARPAVMIEIEARNASAKPITIQALEPVTALPESGGALLWPGVTKVLTNGPMYYDPGRIAELPTPKAGSLKSWWNIGFFRGYHQPGLVAGYIDNQTAQGQVSVSRGDAQAIGLVATSALATQFELPPGRTVRSGRFMLNLAPDPYHALETYADTMGRALGARVDSIVNGWCDWFMAYESITEEEVIRNAEFAARTLRPFGFEYVQVDEGFQRWHGDWEGNAKFPHGMKWLADRIRSLGLKPGIWLAPYVISEPTEVFQQHQDWLLRHPDGQLKRVGPWPSEDSDWARSENPKRYGLDITHPGAAAWLADLFDTVANRWGYDMIKIDFVDWSLLAAARYHDPSVTRAEAYRKGMEIMRRAMGPNRHLLDCGPGPVTVGLLDSMRIELDQPPVTWKQYFLESASSAPAAAKRYYFHKRTWINDADHICLNLLSPPQAQAAATLIALTGGNTMSGDRLPDLDPTRLEILKKVLPSYGEAARPADLFDSDRPSVFALKVRKAFGEWTVAGFFNVSESDPVDFALPLGRLWLDPGKTYLAYDFWNERFHGEIAREVRVHLAPASVLLLALHEKRGHPQVLSTTRHVLQGALELETVSWQPDTRTLSGVSLAPPGTAHNIAVYTPEPHPWIQGGPFLYHDFPAYTLKMTHDHILNVHVRFADTSRVPWQVNFDQFFSRR